MATSGHKDDPVIKAAADQLNARAIEALRTSPIFGLFLPTEVDDKEGMQMMFCGPTVHFLGMHAVITQQLAKMAAEDFLKILEGKMQEEDVISDYLNLDVTKGGESDTDA